MCQNDPKPPSASDSAKASYQAALQYLPGIFDLENKNIQPNEQATLNATKAIEPGYTQLASDILQGPGQNLISGVQSANKSIDPQFFAGRDAAGGGLTKLLSSIDLTGMLSGSERSEIERNLNRTNAGEGNGSTPNPTTTIQNAMQFGGASQAKKAQQQQAATGAINAATGFLPSSRQGIDPLQIATGRPSFAPGAIGAGTQAGSGQFLSSSADATANQAVLNAQRKSSVEKALGAMPDYSG